MESTHQNKIELIGLYGGDKTHCLSAWTSTAEELGIELPESIVDRVDVIFEYICKKKKKTPEELLQFLAEHGHGTPFEKSFIHFITTVETASHIHSLKHRIGVSISVESARYKELSDKYYLPQDWRGAGEVGREWLEKLESHILKSYELYHKCIDELSPNLGRKRAKESARFFLPYGIQVAMDVSFNFRSFVHFLSLRNKQGAQLEIREIASKMLELVRESGQFELSLKAFNL